jgi:hypothetical protein
MSRNLIAAGEYLGIILAPLEIVLKSCVKKLVLVLRMTEFSIRGWQTQSRNLSVILNSGFETSLQNSDGWKLVLYLLIIFPDGTKPKLVLRLPLSKRVNLSLLCLVVSSTDVNLQII